MATTAAETVLFETTEPTAEMVRAALLSVHELPVGERYRRVGRIAARLRTFAPELAGAASGFQAHGLESVTFKAL